MKYLISSALLFMILRSFCQQPPAIDSLKKLISKATPDTSRVNMLDDLCWEYMYFDPQQSISYAEEAITLAQKLGYKKGEGRLYNTLGAAFSNLTKLSDAMRCYEKALAIKKTINDQPGEASCLINIGNAYQTQAYYDKAITYYLQGLSILEKLGDLQRMATTYGNIASVYENQGDFAKVLLYTSKSLTIAQSLHDHSTIMNASISMGNIYHARKEYKTALEYYEKALVEAFSIHDYFGKAMCHNNIGRVYNELNRPSDALKHYNEQLKIAKIINSQNDEVYAISGLGKTYLQLKNYEVSHTLLSKALTLSQKLGTRNETKQLYEDLSLLHEEKKEYKEAIRYHKKFDQLKDSLFNEAKLKQINELSVTYETTKKEDEIKILNKNNQLQALAISRERSLKNISIGGLVLILIFALLLYKSNRQRTTTNKLLSLQKQQLQESNHVKTKLFSIISHDLRSPLTSLHGLLQIIESKGAPSDVKYLIDHANAMMTSTINLLDNLLYWSANEVKGFRLNFESINVYDIAEEVVSLFFQLSTAKKLTIINNVRADTMVYADALSVKLVLRNLLSNAIKFTPPGGTVVLSAFNKHDELEISVADTGIGIKQQDVTKLFGRDQSSTPGTSNEKGTGLGLFLCKEFVEKNGGKIWAEHGLEKGMIFKFTVKRYEVSCEPSGNRLTNFFSTTEA